MTSRPRFASFVFGALLSGAPLAAQEPGNPIAVPQPGPYGAPVVTEPPADRLAEWNRFVERHPGVWRAQWNPATGTPQAVYGDGMPIADWRENTLEEGRRHAYRVLFEEGGLLGLGNSDFREVIGARMGRTWSFTFDQYHRGLPVIGGRADVRVSMAGRVAMLGSVAFDIPTDFGITPAIPAEAATLAAWQLLGEAPTTNPQNEPAKAPRLVIWGDAASAQRVAPSLAWEIAVANIAADGSGKLGRSYIDARTGALLRFVSDKHQCGANCTHASHRDARAGVATAAVGTSAPPVSTTLVFMAYTRASLSGTSAPVLMPMIGLEVNFTGLGTLTTNAAGAITVNISAPTIFTINGFAGTHHQTIAGSSAPNFTLPATPGLNQTFTLVGSSATSAQLAHSNCAFWIGRVNEWARGILGNTSQLNALDNIAVNVNIASTCNAYYSGNSLNFYAAGGGCVNAAFSTVIAHEWGHALDSQYGGISNTPTDGLSEGWGDTVAMYLVDDPNVGEDFHGASSGSLRDGNNTVIYGTQTEEHAAGESWMGFAWRFREFLAGTMTRTQAKAISNDVFLGSIVADADNQIAATLEVFLADDDDGILNNGTPHYQQLMLGAALHGLPVPQLGGPANDYCAGAVTVVDGLNGPYSNTGATALTSTWNCSAGTADNDVWFRYVAASAGQLTVSTCGLTTLNTKIQIRSGSCGGAVLACADDTCGAQTTVSAQVPAGTLYIQVGAASFGSFSLQVWGPGSASGVSHGTGCGSTPLALTGTPPRLGTTLTLTTSPFSAATSIGLQMLGNVGYTGGISLAPFGMPGCYQWSEFLVINTLVSSGPAASYTMPIPNNAALLGYQLKAQSARMAPGYNSFGFITSNGWWMTVGN